jgi:hypothetical protein
MDASPPNPEPARRRRWRARLGATALSAGVHAGLLAALLIGWGATATPIFQPAIDVSVAPPFAPPAPKPPTPLPRSPAKRTAPRKAPVHVAAAPRIAARPSPAPPVPESLPAAFVRARAAGDGAELSGDQLAGAQAAGEGDGAGGGSGGGSGGGECNMARRVQAALRKDPLARAALRAASGHAIMVWNGDWVQSGAEDGKGLAAVREAITWEVAFAPPECRRQRMRGLVLLSLNDGSPRLALGAGDWRWSDLLGLR